MIEQISIPSEVDFVAIKCVVQIDRSAVETWQRIGSFAMAGMFLNVPSKLLAGDGGIGSVRQIGDAIIEAMVGESDTSYAYVQTKGPVADLFYHGSLALSASGEARCTLTYTISYNQLPLTPEARVEMQGRLAARFMGAAEAMKRVVEEEVAA